jgi:hypothetical protein
VAALRAFDAAVGDPGLRLSTWRPTTDPCGSPDCKAGRCRWAGVACAAWRVIEVNVSADPLQRVDLGQGGAREVSFSYSVRWQATDVAFGDRMSRYAQSSFLPQSFEIHWLSIINSFVLVLLLTGFLSIILMRVL